MNLRQGLIIGIALGIFALFMFATGQLSKKEEAPKREIPKSIKPVEVQEVLNQSVQTQVALYGRLTAFEKTELFSELGGMLIELGKPFRPGIRFNKGEIMLRLDQGEQNLALKAQKAALLALITQILPDIKTDFPDRIKVWEEYRRNFSLEQTLPPLPKAQTEREQDYLALRNIYNQYYQIQSVEERLKKYELRAPFDGELSEALISTGTYIRAGQKLGTLMNTQVYELEASVALADLKFIKLGDAVRLESEEGGQWTGRISRISSSIDTRTQTVKVYVQVNGSGLKENLYLSGYIAAERQSEVMELPRTLVEDDKVFAVQDSTLVRLPVQVVKMGKQTALVKGLSNGTILLKDNFPGAFEGMKVAPLPLKK